MTERKTAAERLTELQAKREKALQRERAVARQIAKLQSQEADRTRQQETRQKVIVGGWLKANDPARWDEIVSSLTRAQDRAAFDQSLQTGNPQPAAESVMQSETSPAFDSMHQAEPASLQPWS